MTNRARVGEVAQVRNGYAFDSADFQNTGVAVIRMSDLSDSFVDTKNAARVPEHFLSELSEFRIEKGDLIIGMSGSVGKFALYDSAEPALQNQRIGVLKIRDRERLDHRYLRFFCFTLEEILLKIGKGVAVKNVSGGEIEDLLIPLPPLPEQQRIAALLDKADRLRRLRRYALDLGETYLQSVFLEMFGDPVRNPKKWRLAALEDVALVNRGRFSPRPRNDPKYYGGKYPFIQTGDIANSNGSLEVWTQTLNEEGIRVSRAFDSGTIVMAIVGATIGETSILKFRSYCPDSVVGICVDPKLCAPVYIEHTLRFWKPVLRAMAPETARANINLETLRPLKVPVPPLALQEKFAGVVRQYDRLRAQQRESLRQAEMLFGALLEGSFQPHP
jgi:type I restriction enzyme, S subunit